MYVYESVYMLIGEAEEEEQQEQQMDMRGLQPEAIDPKLFRSRSHGQGSPPLRPIVQHVPPILRRLLGSHYADGATIAEASARGELQEATNRLDRVSRFG